MKIYIRKRIDRLVDKPTNNRLDRAFMSNKFNRLALYRACYHLLSNVENYSYHTMFLVVTPYIDGCLLKLSFDPLSKTLSIYTNNENDLVSERG